MSGAPVSVESPLLLASFPVVTFGESIGQATIVDRFFGFSAICGTFIFFSGFFQGLRRIKPLYLPGAVIFSSSYLLAFSHVRVTSGAQCVPQRPLLLNGGFWLSAVQPGTRVLLSAEMKASPV